MIAFISLFFPAVFALSLYECFTKTSLSLKKAIFRFCNYVLFTNLGCLFLKKCFLHTADFPLLFEGDMLPIVGFNYIIMSLLIVCVFLTVEILLAKFIKIKIEKNPIKEKKRFLLIICIFLLLIGFFSYNAAKWYIDTYGDLGFDAILYTLLSDLSNTESNLIFSFLLHALLPSILSVFCIAFVLFSNPSIKFVLYFKEKKLIKLYPFSKFFSFLFSIVLTFISVSSAMKQVDLVNYINSTAQQTSIYEEKYVDPFDVAITFPSEKQNLIYLYLESMETSFLSGEAGGGNDTTVIPELYDLAQEYVNFSHNDDVGGYASLSGTNWTIAAMVSNTAGVPLKLPPNANGNDYGQDSFLPGIHTLSDVLHKNGYYQALMVGSDSSFGGRKQYYEQHGTDKIYDLFTAREDGIIPEDYMVWWGMEDAYLFEYAKQELPKLASMDEPFSLTMLTVDTHHIDGYVCAYCQDIYPTQYENVLACSSKQVQDFIMWVQNQDFYENTTIIITGDHPTMDNEFISTNITPNHDRRVYNCFINSKNSTDNTKNRQSCSLDMFPTTLSAMGCTIEGDRLGLGTDLFSNTPTYCEELGIGAFNSELSMSSNFYTRTFFFE